MWVLTVLPGVVHGQDTDRCRLQAKAQFPRLFEMEEVLAPANLGRKIRAIEAFERRSDQETLIRRYTFTMEQDSSFVTRCAAPWQDTMTYCYTDGRLVSYSWTREGRFKYAMSCIYDSDGLVRIDHTDAQRRRSQGLRIERDASSRVEKVKVLRSDGKIDQEWAYRYPDDSTTIAKVTGRGAMDMRQVLHMDGSLSFFRNDTLIQRQTLSLDHCARHEENYFGSATYPTSDHYYENGLLIQEIHWTEDRKETIHVRYEYIFE